MKRRKRRERLPKYFDIVPKWAFWSIIGVGIFYFLKQSGTLGETWQQRYNWCRNKTMYIPAMVVEALRRGALTEAMWRYRVSTQENAWLNTLSAAEVRGAYFTGYIVPYLHGMYGGNGSSNGTRRHRSSHCYGYDCDRYHGHSWQWQERQDILRGEQQGIGGEG